jgi:hypothetical protein
MLSLLITVWYLWAPLSSLFLAPLPTPVTPSWKPTWMTRFSTTIMPCNISGFFNPTFAATYGLVDYDWSNNRNGWVRDGSCESSLLTAAYDTLRAGAGHAQMPRVFVYRNSIKALPFFESVRRKLTDPAYAGWFLHTADGKKLYSESYLNLPEYLFDFTNGTMFQNWFVEEYIMGPTGAGSPLVSGLFLDDWWQTVPGTGCAAGPYGGPTECVPGCLGVMGLTATDVAAQKAAYELTMKAATTAMLAAGKWPYPLFEWASAPVGGVGSCIAFFKSRDGYAYQDYAMLYTLTLPVTPVSLTVDIVTFLLLRGPYAWFGYSWQGCTTNDIPGFEGTSYIDTDILPEMGVPLDSYHETVPGVFKRDWTNGAVSFNCWSGEARADNWVASTV